MFLNVSEAAERANVSESLIRRWTTGEKRLAHFRLGGRGKRGKLIIDSRDLDIFLETLKVMADSWRPVHVKNLKILTLK